MTAYNRVLANFLHSSFPIKITLPSGVKVIVDRQYWGLNVYVWAPADPDHASEGLCGNNNEDANDDFGQWKSANQFGEHWRYISYATHTDLLLVYGVAVMIM